MAEQEKDGFSGDAGGLTSLEQLGRYARSKDPADRLAVARNPNVWVELLERLSNDGDGRVVMAVAGNPRATPEILHRLSHCEDKAILIAVIHNQRTGAATLKELATHPERAIRDEARRVGRNRFGTRQSWTEAEASPPAPESKSDNADDGAIAQKIERLKYIEKMTAKDIEGLKKIRQDTNEKIRDLENALNVTRAEIERLDNRASPNEETIAVGREWTPREILEAVLLWFPTNQGLSPEQITRLANSQDPRHRIAAAIKLKAPIEVIEKLSRDRDPAVTRAVARNQAATPQILDRLSRSDDITTVLSVVCNKNTSAETLKTLAFHQERCVRHEARWVGRNRFGTRHSWTEAEASPPGAGAQDDDVDDVAPRP